MKVRIVIALFFLGSCIESGHGAKGDLGIDVSHHNGAINWSKMEKAKVRFAIIKATEGATYRDPNLVFNFNGARTNQIETIGLYHYFRMSSTVQDQFDNLKRAMDQVSFDLSKDILAIDFEITKSDPGLSGSKSLVQRQQIADRLWQLLELCSVQLKIEPLLYTNPGSWQSLIDPNRKPFVQYRLWLAHYTQAKWPRIPEPWTNWFWWQYTDQGQIDGIEGKVDLNHSNQ